MTGWEEEVTAAEDLAVVGLAGTATEGPGQEVVGLAVRAREVGGSAGEVGRSNGEEVG